MVAPVTKSPTPFFTGIDSPVASDSSIMLLPSIIFPSVGIFSPGLIIMISLMLNSFVATSIS